MLAYLDPSSIDAAIRADIAPGAFLASLGSLGYTPVASHMVLHELARPLVARKWDIGMTQCRYLRDLSPSWHVSARDLYAQKVAFFRAHETITPSLDPGVLADTLAELDGLCVGQIRPALFAAIEERNISKATDWPTEVKKSLAGSKELRRSGAPTPPLGSFQEFMAFFTPDLPYFLMNAPSTKLTALEARSIVRQLDTYPTIRANVNCWFYLGFIAEKNKTVPAHDRLDDTRHIVEASYCKALLSNDKGLLRAIPDISPHLKPLPWQAIVAAA